MVVAGSVTGLGFVSKLNSVQKTIFVLLLGILWRAFGTFDVSLRGVSDLRQYGWVYSVLLSVHPLVEVTGLITRLAVRISFELYY